MPLTKRDVDRAEGPKVLTPSDRKRSTWYPDAGSGGVTGFGLRVYGSGQKVFVLRYRNDAGRSRTLKVGNYGDLTVQQARDLAREKKLSVLRGEDPQAERRIEQLAVSTVEELCRRWLSDYAQVHRRSAEVDAYRVDRRIVPEIGSTRLEDVSVGLLSKWHRSIGEEAPVEANRCLETLRSAWRWGEDQEILPADATDSSIFRGGRRARIRRFREKSRDRWLRPHEVQRLMEAVRDEDDPFVRAGVPLLLLTGLRKRESLHARWSDVDLERGEIRLAKTKSGSPQTRLLPGPAVELLQSLPRAHGSPYIFPSPQDARRPRDDIKRAWQRIRKAADLEDVRIHDLRRTAGSYMAQAGVPIQTIQKVLGHSHPAVTQLYARLSSKNEREALDSLAKAIMPSMEALRGSSGGAEPKQSITDEPSHAS